MSDYEHPHGRDVHGWFGLTYAQYLTIPRVILDAMPGEWQARFVRCLIELGATFDWLPKEGRYWVRLKDGRGRYVVDPLMEYRHPHPSDLDRIARPDDERESILHSEREVGV
jgi:hypothetical protein